VNGSIGISWDAGVSSIEAAATGAIHGRRRRIKAGDALSTTT
jgi:hypothetical protein